MNVAAITAKTHRLTKTDTNTYTDANILIDLNLIEAELAVFVLKVQGYRDFQGNKTTCNLVSVTGLSAGSIGYNGEYPFPDDFLKLKRLEVKYDDSSIPVLLYDQSTNQYSENEDPGDGFSSSTPYVRFDRGSYFIRPLPTTSVTGGIYLEYEQKPTVLTTGTPCLDTSFHRIYPLMLAKEYSQENPEKYNQLWDVEIEKIKREIANFYRKRVNYTKEITTYHESYK